LNTELGGLDEANGGYFVAFHSRRQQVVDFESLGLRRRGIRKVIPTPHRRPETAGEGAPSP